MILELLKEPFLLLLTTFITGLGGWFFGRRKANVEADGQQIENFDKGLVYYQKLVDDLGVRLEKAIAELQKSEAEKKEVIEKFSQATETVHELEKKIDSLTNELKKYKQLNGKS